MPDAILMTPTAIGCTAVLAALLAAACTWALMRLRNRARNTGQATRRY